MPDALLAVTSTWSSAAPGSRSGREGTTYRNAVRRMPSVGRVGAGRSEGREPRFLQREAQ